MRSTETKVVPFRPAGDKTVELPMDGNRFSSHPAVQRGGMGKNRRFKYWARKEVVDTYLAKKKEQGGDPVSSTAVRCGIDRHLVERILDVEIGRMPSWTEDADMWSCNAGRVGRDWEEYQRKLNKEYGPCVIQS